ncbi:hypothetical protein CXG81DRAFT_15094 [Caulochytrium protostelioides]|uniref:P-loop containing nucleoside triphosphate hydrolase protein n=1 Tax=Caulochytrium protostelioides TaxID=1555241 RepID=A0A4P9WZZ3_9FUNG|nr:hypothetical protein CXG81DRAFT_15094 [Caulochytrium protostelioides]|eukprot:RKO99051.1 hypothetical protein CXG81DRAFT_15094 [Caulochytrium protostelioides]
MELVWPERGLFLLAMTALLINAVAQMAAPFLLGRMVDRMHSHPDELLVTVMQLLAAFVIGSFCVFVRANAFLAMGYRIVTTLRTRLFHRLLQQDIAFYDVSKTGDLTGRLASDTQALQQVLTAQLGQLLSNLLQGIATIVMLFLLSWRLTLFMMTVVPFVALGVSAYGRFVRQLRQQFQHRLAETGAMAQEAFANIRTIKGFGKETLMERVYAERNTQCLHLGETISFATALFQGLLGFVPQVAILLVLYYGTTLVAAGSLSSGVLTTFLLYTLTLAMSLAFLASLVGEFAGALGASARIFELLVRVPAIPPAGSGGVRLPRFDGHLALQNVAFSYPGRPNAPVLEDFTLTLRPGQVLALIGPSGHGKSTVLHLLQRFYDPTRGRVLLDHTCPLSKVDLRWYRRHIGYVPQDPVLFDGTIHDNIAMGWADDEDDMDAGQDRRSGDAAHRRAASVREVTRDAVIAAAQTANAHEFIMEFPLGYDTPVGERGLALSGGQKQRIALARALVRDPRVLLLDEATSALSSDAEAAVQRGVARASAGRTTVVVGHKLSAFKDADRCAVIVRGRVVELGSHDELMDKARTPYGIYRRLIEKQLVSADQRKSVPVSPRSSRD